MEQAQEEPHADMLLLPEAIAGFHRSEPPSLPASRRMSQLTADSAAALPCPHLPEADSSQKSGSGAQGTATKRAAEAQPPEESQEAWHLQPCCLKRLLQESTAWQNPGGTVRLP